MYSRTHRIQSFAKIRANFKLSQAWRQDGWVDRQVAKGRLSSVYADIIKNLAPIMDVIFPDNWDVQFELTQLWSTHINEYKPVGFDEQTYEYYIQENTRRDSQNRDEDLLNRMFSVDFRTRQYFGNVYYDFTDPEFTYATKALISGMSFIIRYPEITVSNSKKQSLPIRDLFVKIVFSSEGNVYQDIYGTRTTYTLDEFENNYTHSHLPKKQLKSFKTSTNRDMPYRLEYQTFCLGTGEINDFIGLYNGTKDSVDFESIMYMLNTVVSWESLEGVPHATIANILAKLDSVPNVSLNESQKVFEMILSKSSKYESFNIDWQYKNEVYEIIDNENFEDFLRLSYLGIEARVLPREYVGYKDETGTFYVPTDIKPGATEIQANDFIPFRGEKFILKVEGELKFSGERKWYLNPKIKQYVKSKLECVFNKTQIRKSAIAKLNQTQHYTGVPTNS